MESRGQVNSSHVLSSCPTALSQQRYAFRHNQVLSILASTLTDTFADIPFVKVYADLPNFFANDAPQATILSDLLITSYRPDIVIYNTQYPSITLAVVGRFEPQSEHFA